MNHHTLTGHGVRTADGDFAVEYLPFSIWPWKVNEYKQQILKMTNRRQDVIMSYDKS